MNLKRVAWTGALLWALIFFEVSILMFGFKLEEVTLNVIHYILLAVLISFTALIYFKDKKIKRNLKEGITLGAMYVAIGLILDTLITVPLFVKAYSRFFVNSPLLIGLAETLLITSITGMLKKPNL